MTHSEFQPGQTACPGTIYLERILQGRRGTRPVHACDTCGWTDLPQRPGRTDDSGQTADHLSPTGAKPVKLKLCVHRKAGAPNYGSDGAGAELELDIDDDLAGKPGQLVEVSRVWYGALETAVAQELARLQAQHPAPTPVASAPTIEPDRPGPEPTRERRRWNPDDLPPPPDRNGGPPPRRGSGGGGGGGKGPPRDGRQLIGWANGQGLYDALMSLANSANRGRIVDWDPDMVQWAYTELSRSQMAVGSWGGN